MSYLAEEADVIVVGGGHAGCEAALAAARMGLKTIIFAISLDSIAMMPCNPSIGGSSKGHLVREIDALGGEMGKNIDKTYIQTKMLNTGKGPAVYSLRAQADKGRYQREMKRTLEKTENLYIRQGEVTQVLVEDGAVTGVMTSSQAEYRAKAVVLCMGTYMKARCLYGETIVHSGPNGLMPATELSKSLLDLGITLYRFKTGTPARIDGNTIDFSKMTPQYGDENIVPFSFENTPEEIKREQVPCYLAYTNADTHNLIRDNLHRSAMYGGLIHGTGPRYCPSIEDKIVRFADKERHQIFIEPEGEDTCEMYIQGMSTSLPEEVQVQMYRTIPGMENCRIMRNAYAIEYDCIDATQLKLSLEFKKIKGLFSAGQFNGSSGYEEAAAQGLIAGINAAHKIQGKEPFVLDRASSYIGTLIDDLITKGVTDPYRMMTSRSEYRLVLRQDNADERLTPKGREIGLIGDDRWNRFIEKQHQKEQEYARAKKTVISPTEKVNDILIACGTTPIQTGTKLIDLIRRPQLNYEVLTEVDPERPDYPKAVFEGAEIEMKYDGYIKRQKADIEEMRRLEQKVLPKDVNYHELVGLRKEAQEKLQQVKPANIGQASRISGVSPADISVLLIWLSKL